MNSGRRLTIAMPTSSFLPTLGGMEVGLHNIARRLAALGHRPVVVAPAANVCGLRRRGMQLPYTVVSFPPKLFTLIARAPRLALWAYDAVFAWVARRYHVDVWHGTMCYPTGVALAHYGRANAALPALVRCAGDDIQRLPEIGYGMRLDPRVDAQVRRWLPRVPLLVAISASVASEYRELGVPEDRIVAIPNGVDLAAFLVSRPRAEVRRALGLPETAFLFLAVARNHPKKNLAAILAAAAALKDRDVVPDWAVAIAGRGVPALQNEAERLGVSGRVRLLDEIGPAEGENDLPARDLIDLYCAADAFVFPSRIETFGIAIVEAMAAGLPVIAGDSPGCRDIVDGGRYGLLVPPADSTALADAMALVATDRGERARLAALSRERARAYDWDAVVERYVATYWQLLARAA